MDPAFTAFPVADLPPILEFADNFHRQAVANEYPGNIVVSAGPSGLPLPRFVSLSTDKVNVRRGPGRNYTIAWVFVRDGLPVEIIGEFENWRQIRDWEGSEGWVHRSLLSGRRTAIIAPWDDEAQFALRQSPSDNANIIAYLQAKLVTTVRSCEKNWCRLEDDRFDGWIEQNRLWGVYPQEIVDD